MKDFQENSSWSFENTAGKFRENAKLEFLAKYCYSSTIFRKTVPILSNYRLDIDSFSFTTYKCP